MTRVYRQEGAGRGGSPPFTDFWSFREMIREGHEAALAEREATAAEARVERGMAVAKQRLLIAEVLEVKL